MILVEGYKNSQKPKILCAETASDARIGVQEIPNVIIVSGSIAGKIKDQLEFESEFPDIKVFNIDEIVTALKKLLVKEILYALPGMNCGHCGYDTCLGLAKAILNGEATREKCEVLSTNITTVRIDNQTIPLGRFPQEILREVTLGVLNTLKGVKKHLKRIEITIKNEYE
jgi:hypothetical protein